MRCFSTLTFLAALIVLLGFAPPAIADTVLFQDDFEDYVASTSWPSTDDANPGTPPLGEPWFVYEPLPDRIQVQSTPAGTNNCAGPHGGSNYLHTYTRGPAPAIMISSDGQSLIEEYQNLVLDMWVYKNKAAGWNGLQTIGAYDNDQPIVSSGGRSFLLYFRNDGKLQYFNDALIDTGLTYTPDSWVHLIVDANYSTHKFSVTLNGQTVTDLDFDMTVSKAQHVLFYGSTDDDTNARAAFDDIMMFVRDPSVPVPGDANGDGYVNATDAQALAENWLITGGAFWHEGDFNADGNVDDLDAALMAANWGRTPGAASASVPEPSGITLIIVTALAGLGYTFRKTR